MDYSAYISDTSLKPLNLSAQQYQYVFTGNITVQLEAGKTISIPSVAPNANIIEYQTEPDVPLQFFKDESDNFYIESDSNGEVTLTFKTSADPTYFTLDIPPNVTLADIPAEVGHDPPQQVKEIANVIIGQLGLTQETNIDKIVDTLKSYFSSFTAGDIPSVAEEPDPYLAIAESKHGDCYARSFAFFVTANSMGLPTRLVQNEGNAFVETYIPTKGWEMIDLGGLGNVELNNPNGYTPFETTSSDEGLATLTPVPTSTIIPSQTPGFTPNPTTSLTPTPLPGPTLTPIPSQTPGLTPTPIAGLTSTPSPEPTLTPIPDETPGMTPSQTQGPILTPTPTPTVASGFIPVVTNTTITALPGDVSKGGSFSVEGTVLTDTGAGVEGMTVEVFLNQTKLAEGGILAGTGLTSTGHFLIDCTVPKDMNVGDYQVIAHAIELTEPGYIFKESWSDPSIRVKAYTITSVDLPSIVEINKSVEILGSLTEEFGEPVAGEQVILYEGDSDQIEKTVTSQDGTFALEYTFNKVGDYILTARFAGSTYYSASSSEPVSVNVAVPTNISLNTVEEALSGKSVNIAGDLSDIYGTAIVGQEIKIYLDSDLITALPTEANGAFSEDHTFVKVGTYQIKAEFQSIQHYLGSTNTAGILVKAATSLTISAPNRIHRGARLKVEAALTDNVEMPISGANVYLSGDNLSATTNDKGVASFNLQVPEDSKEKYLSISCEFGGTDLYLPSNATLQLPIVGKRAFPYWVFAFIPVVGGGGLGGYLLLKRRRAGQSGPPSSISTTPSPNAFQINPEATVSLKTTITINFPGIEDQLPAVWGLGQILVTEALLVDSQGIPLNRKGIIALAGQKTLGTIATDQEGRANILLTFNGKGDYIISCQFAGDSRHQPADATKAIRIVDYREEIIAIFDSLIDWAKGRGIAIPKDATPREIQRSLANRFNIIDHHALEKVIWTFEEADYSTHPISRQQYKTMFLSAKRMRTSAEG